MIVFGAGEDRTERKVSNGEINRELTTLKRILNLARQNGKLTHVPHIPMLERNVRTGFFERDQITRIVAHLPTAIRPAVQSRTSPDGGSRARCYRYNGGTWISKPVSSVWILHDEERRKPHVPVHRRPRTAPGGSKAEHDRLKART